MLSKNSDVRDDNYVTDLVVKDFRTARVFRKYGIDYCCGGRIPLQLACEIGGLNTASVKAELTDAMRNINISNSTNFNEWNIEFLINYIVNVHHAYLHDNLEEATDTFERFLERHQTKYPFLKDRCQFCAPRRSANLPE